MSRGRPLKIWCVCLNPVNDRNSAITCKGPDHADRFGRLFCHICRNGGDTQSSVAEWKCQKCDSDESEPSSASEREQNASESEEDENPTPPRHTNSQQSEANESSNSSEYDWTTVLAKFTDPTSFETRYLIRWEDHNGFAQVCSWEPPDDNVEIWESKLANLPVEYYAEHPRDRKIIHAAQSGSADAYLRSLDEKSMNEEYRDALDVGFQKLLSEMHSSIIKHSSEAGLQDLDDLIREGLEILFSTHPGVLAACTGSGLVRRKLLDHSVREYLDDLWEKSRDRPSVYIIELVDYFGRPMTLGDTRKLMEAAESYLFGDEPENHKRAIDIDSLMATGGELTNAEKGQRAVPGERSYCSAQSQNAFSDLQNVLAPQLAECTAKESARLWSIFADAGYAVNAPKRIKEEHKKHKGSNKLMCLFEAISHRELGGRYTLEGNVVFLCLRSEHIAFGEVFFTCLRGTYVETGWGLNKRMAGVNKGNFTKQSFRPEWGSWMHDALQSDVLRRNVREQKAKADELAKLNQELEEIEIGRSRDALEQLEVNEELRRQVFGLDPNLFDD